MFQKRDLERTVGINTFYVSDRDYKLEKGDIDMLLEVGYLFYFFILQNQYQNFTFARMSHSFPELSTTEPTRLVFQRNLRSWSWCEWQKRQKLSRLLWSNKTAHFLWFVCVYVCVAILQFRESEKTCSFQQQGRRATLSYLLYFVTHRYAPLKTEGPRHSFCPDDSLPYYIDDEFPSEIINENDYAEHFLVEATSWTSVSAGQFIVFVCSFVYFLI